MLVAVVGPQVGILDRVVAALLEGLPDLRLVFQHLPDIAVAVGQVQLLGHLPDRGLPGHLQGVLVNLHRVEVASMSIEVPYSGVGVIGEARQLSKLIETVDAGVVHRHADPLLCLSVSIILGVHTMSRRKEEKSGAGPNVLEARSAIGIRGAGRAKSDRIRGRRSQDDWAPGHICLDGGSSSPGAPKCVWRGGAKKARGSGA